MILPCRRCGLPKAVNALSWPLCRRCWRECRHRRLEAVEDALLATLAHLGRCFVCRRVVPKSEMDGEERCPDCALEQAEREAREQRES